MSVCVSEGRGGAGVGMACAHSHTAPARAGCEGVGWGGVGIWGGMGVLACVSRFLTARSQTSGAPPPPGAHRFIQQGGDRESHMWGEDVRQPLGYGSRQQLGDGLRRSVLITGR